jgi:hypothetical protein
MFLKAPGAIGASPLCVYFFRTPMTASISSMLDGA